MLVGHIVDAAAHLSHPSHRVVRFHREKRIIKVALEIVAARKHEMVRVHEPSCRSGRQESHLYKRKVVTAARQDRFLVEPKCRVIGL